MTDGAALDAAVRRTIARGFVGATGKKKPLDIWARPMWGFDILNEYFRLTGGTPVTKELTPYIG